MNVEFGKFHLCVPMFWLQNKLTATVGKIHHAVIENGNISKKVIVFTSNIISVSNRIFVQDTLYQVGNYQL